MSGELMTPNKLNTGLRDRMRSVEYALTTMHDYGTPDDHFEGVALDAAWTWSAATGFVTPSSVVVGDSYLQAAFGTGQGQKRAMLYRTTNLTAAYQARVGLLSSYAGGIIGLGLCDNTADNALFIVLHNNAGTLRATRYGQTGGGGWATNNLATIDPLPPGLQVTLRYEITGTPWSSWAFNCYLSINAYRAAWYMSGTGHTWTPTRRGLIFYNDQATNADSWREFHVDWYSRD